MLTVIFKETEACNSNCIYCDVVAKRKPRTMSIDMLEKVYVQFAGYLEKSEENSLNIIWHGGEPCMAGIDFYKKALQFQEKYCSKWKNRIRYAIQSNLTLMDKSFIDIFRQMGINSIGTSFEILPRIRGFGKSRDSEKYIDGFFKGIDLLNRNEMGWGFIYVATRPALQFAKEIFYHLANLSLGHGFDIHPVVVFGSPAENKIVIKSADFAHFLGEIFKIWWPIRTRYPEVDPFRNYLRNYENKERSLSCGNCGDCAYTHIYLGPDGETSHCGRTADWDIIWYGSLFENSLTDLANHPDRMQLDQRIPILKNGECKECEYWEICRGGCPLDSWNVYKDFNHKTEWCDVNRIFLKEYFEPITNLKPIFN